jgi:HSP20 family protein
METSVQASRLPMRQRLMEPWPRLFDLLDSLTPGELTWHPEYDHVLRLEQIRRDGELLIRAEIPGVDPEEDIEITLDHDVLTIEAQREERHEEGARSEFHYGRLRRCITLPEEIDEDDITASYVDGILEISVTMPSMTEESTPSNRIPIKS